MDTTKVFIFSLTGILFTIGILILLYKSYESLNKKMLEENFTRIGKIDTSQYSVIPSAEIDKPKDGFNYTFFLEMKIKNFYHNYGYWKHILHVGTEIDSLSVLEYPYEGEGIDNWDSVIADFPNQNPGIWLHPTKNTIRIVISTEEHEEGNFPSHAHPETIFKASETTELDNIRRVINTFDIKDIPINTNFKLALSIFENSVTVYLNGKIRNIFTINGKPFENSGSMFIHRNKTYSGEILRGQLHPTILNDKKIFKL